MFDKVLIANRGAIAVRIERTLRKMNIKSVAVYAEADLDSLHVEHADEAICLGEGPVKDTYLCAEKIIAAALKTKAKAIHPGYGFLSENTDFAKACAENGIRFIGPLPEQIEAFGLKHRARELAVASEVPLLPGSGLLDDCSDALACAGEVGYPVMLKSTAGGGGIGIRICNCAEDIKDCFDNVRHLAKANFNDAGVFVEKYIARARHIEVQIFGNEYGEAIAIGERDCSVQRRNQKVLEEAPAPLFGDEIRQKMLSAAARLAKSVGYRSAGTVEFLYDPESGGFYFLEVNTRLQVEHGITEEITGIDLVEWMVKEAVGELKGLTAPAPKGHAIEARIYAEDCHNNFRPSTGKIDELVFAEGTRVESWLRKNIEISPLYDPMLAKMIVHGRDRKDALEKLERALSETKIYGVTTNLRYLHAMARTDAYRCGDVFTTMLDGFQPAENTIEVLDGGLQTTVQDWPGMLGYWTVGVPPCGPFDSYSFRIGNRLLGNREGEAGLEMTLRGGSYRFRADTSFCVVGADMSPTLDEKPVQLYSVIAAKAGQTLTFGECKIGMRAYLLIAGGIDAPEIMGSRSTFIDGKFGGHNGRPLRTGDVLGLGGSLVAGTSDAKENTFPLEFRPQLANNWVLGVIPGPLPTSEYLRPEYFNTLTSAEYEVNFNSARTGIRLNGPIPEWVRLDGGEAGLHPSNVHDNPYAIGSLDLTGDQSIMLGPDGPSLGGFVCPVCMAKAEMWKLGQLHPGDKVRFQLLTLEEAEEMRKAQESNIRGAFAKVELPVPSMPVADYAVLASGIEDNVSYKIRIAGEENALIEFGPMELNIELRFRVHVLMQEMEKQGLPIIDMTPGIRSLQVHFDCEKISVKEIARKIESANAALPPLDTVTVASRIIKLPLSWDDPQTQIAAERYQRTVRSNAPWCPSNPEFIRRINGLESIDQLRQIFFDSNYLVLGLGDVYLGAPVATPTDPRHRLVTTKYNPARPWTPENAVGIGGAYLCIYGMEGPGGYQFVGRTIQMWNLLRETEYFPKGKPWLLNFFDQIRFFPCGAQELLQYREDFLRGKYQLEIEQTRFSLAEYKKHLDDIKESAAVFKAKQEAAFQAERQRWADEGLDQFVSLAEAHVAGSEEIPTGCIAVKAAVPGSVWRIEAAIGKKVSKGETVATLESMKMTFELHAQQDGIVERIDIAEGQQVKAGQIVLCIRVDV